RLPRRVPGHAPRPPDPQSPLRGRRDDRLHHRLRAGQARSLAGLGRDLDGTQEDEGQGLRPWGPPRPAGKRGRGPGRALRRARRVRQGRFEADRRRSGPQSLTQELAAISRPKVLLMHSILDPGPALLEEACEVVAHPSNLPLDEGHLRSAAEGCAGIVSQLMDPITDRVLSTPGLKIVSNVAVGFDNIDVVAANRRGVMVTNTPGVLDETTADFAF